MHRILFFLFTIPLICSAQMHDNHWVFGLNSNSDDLGYGTAVVNFSNTIPVFDTLSTPFNFQETVCSMSDSIGNLIFYSNGTAIANSLGEIMQNGDSLNSNCDYREYAEHVGYTFSQSMMALPYPGNANQYVLFHYEHNAYWKTLATYPVRLMMSTIDMNKNGGGGEVTTKNQQILNGEFSGMTAVKHGNGYDWWITMPKDTGGLYYKILLTEDGISSVDSQYVEGQWERFYNPFRKLRDLGWNAITPNGSRFINYYPYFGVRVINFDRCTGDYSNPQQLNSTLRNAVINIWEDPFSISNSELPGRGLAISPNSRFAYTSNHNWIIQYDLEATDINASKKVVATYDGYMSPWGTQFYSMQLMPDGKIYINCGNSENVMHVINQPDLEGIACDIQQHAVQLPVFNIRSMPYFPNYRLYDWEGSPCDTLGIDTPVSTTEIAQKEIERAKVFPNPTSGTVTVEFENVIEKNYQFVLHNAIGQRVFITQLPKGQKQQQLTFSKLPSGIYYYGIGLDGGFVFRTGKLVLE